MPRSPPPSFSNFGGPAPLFEAAPEVVGGGGRGAGSTTSTNKRPKPSPKHTNHKMASCCDVQAAAVLGHK